MRPSRPPSRPRSRSAPRRPSSPRSATTPTSQSFVTRDPRRPPKDQLAPANPSAHTSLSPGEIRGSPRSLQIDTSGTSRTGNPLSAPIDTDRHDGPSSASAPSRGVSKVDSLETPVRTEARQLSPKQTERREKMKSEFRQFVRVFKSFSDFQERQRLETELKQLLETVNGTEMSITRESTRVYFQQAGIESTRAKNELDQAFDDFVQAPHELFRCPGDHAIPPPPTPSADFEGVWKYIDEIKDASDKAMDGCQSVLFEFNDRITKLESEKSPPFDDLNTPLNGLTEQDALGSRKRRRITAETFVDTSALQHMESSISDLQNVTEELRHEVEELRSTAAARNKKTSLSESELEDRFSKLELTFKSKVQKLDEETLSRYAEIQEKIRPLEDAMKSLLSLESKLEEVRISSGKSSESTQTLDVLVKDLQKDLQSLNTNFEQAIQMERQQAQKTVTWREQTERSQNNLTEQLEERGRQISKLSEQVSVLQNDLRQQRETNRVLANNIEAMVRPGPELDILLRQAEERIRNDIVPRVLGKVEENVLAQLGPRLDPMATMIDALVKSLMPQAR